MSAGSVAVDDVAPKSRHGWKAGIDIALLAATAVWVLMQGDSIGHVRDNVGGAASVGVAVVLGLTANVVGALVMAACVASAVSGGMKGKRLAGMDLLAKIRVLVEAAAPAPRLPRFRLGWYLSWAGAVVPPAALVAGVFLLLPRSAWSLAVLPSFDLLVSVALRVPLQFRLVRLWRSDEVGAPRRQAVSMPDSALAAPE